MLRLHGVLSISECFLGMPFTKKSVSVDSTGHDLHASFLYHSQGFSYGKDFFSELIIAVFAVFQ